MTDFDGEDGYRGTAVLEAGGLRRDVQVELRGYFQPIDGRYHWYGRIAADPSLAETLGGGRVSGTLTTPHGSVPAEVRDPDPWGRYRVEGTSTPPFRTVLTSARDDKGAAILPRPADERVDADRYGPGGLPRDVRVAVIGAGFSGVGAGIKLLEAGIRDFAILERADSVGGTWRDNTYPGCACDVPSHLYSFSFAPNARWTRSFSAQPEIRAYLEDVADRPGLRRRMYFGTSVNGADWQPEAAHWLVRTSRGELTADVVIAAAGPLSEPSVPDIPGLEAFPGTVFHSARWDHETELEGRRIAVVGTGASAIQLVPELQKKAAKLVLFQRTPAWVLPRRDRRITGAEQWLYRYVPPAQRLARLGIYLAREITVAGFVRRPGLLKTASRMALLNLERAIKDPELRRKLTPDYIMGCKRILLSNDYYPALAEPNAEVVASGLAAVEGNTVVASDGTRREVDVIVFATGFHAVDMPMAKHVRGADGRTLEEAWDGDMRALRGTTVAGFPNLCFVIGPNTGLGHNSMVHVIESQLSYIVDYLRTLQRTGAASLDTDPAAQQSWCDEVERRMGPTVWHTGGCRSWYLNAAGRNTTLWPGSTVRFRRLTRRVDEHEYIPAASGTASGRAAQHAPSHKPAPRTADIPPRVPDFERSTATVRIPDLFAHPEPTARLRVSSADGTGIHVEVHGPDGAPTVVLIHGWTCNTTFWAPVIKALRSGPAELRVVVYDQRGHGGSEAPPGRAGYSVPILVQDLIAVLDATVPEGERVVLAGHSMGGMTIMAAGGEPAVLARTGGAVLCSTGFRELPDASRVVPGLRRLPKANRAAHRFLLTSSLPIGPVTPISRAMLKRTALGPKADRRLQYVNARIIVACPSKPRSAWGHVLSGLDVHGEAARLDVPTSVVFGTADRLTPSAAHAQAIAGVLPDCVGLTTIAGVGHMTPLEAPDVVAALVRERVLAMQEAEAAESDGDGDGAKLPQQRTAQQTEEPVGEQSTQISEQNPEQSTQGTQTPEQNPKQNTEGVEQ